MRMRNRDLIFEFLTGGRFGTGSNLCIRGNKLINYQTPIAIWHGGVLYLNVKKYSPTTTRNQNLIKNWAEVLGVRYETYEGDFSEHLAQSLASEGILSNDVEAYSA